MFDEYIHHLNVLLHPIAFFFFFYFQMYILTIYNVHHHLVQGGNVIALRKKDEFLRLQLVQCLVDAAPASNGKVAVTVSKVFQKR